MVINTMVFNTLWTRVSSLWRSDESDPQKSGPGTNREEENGSVDAKETLSYAEQVEYGVDERELKDEDKILRLLVKRGGRVEQPTILEETGWSEEHLAEVIAEMESDNQISTITVGRKQVVCRRGFEPKGYRSHLHE